MAKAKHASDPSILQMALVGYEVEKRNIEGRISEIDSLLGGKRTLLGAAIGSAAPAGKRVLSAAARKRIVAGQRKRWAAYRERKEQTASRG